MTSITIQGHQFPVPEAIVARFVPGYTLADEGEANALRQTFLENLRNNFATKVKNAGGAEAPADKVEALTQEFAQYAEQYKFGVRSANGGGAPKRDPIEREMRKLASARIVQAYKAKYNETPDKALVESRIDELLEKRHDEFAKAAKAIIRQRAAVAEMSLEDSGI